MKAFIRPKNMKILLLIAVKFNFVVINDNNFKFL